MAASKTRSHALCGAAFIITLSALMLSILCSSLQAGEFDKQKSQDADSTAANSSNYIPKSDSLASYLKSGKPTLAFFYYSVACSCTAARCAIAAASIDSIPALTSANDSLNFVKIDAYQESDVEVPYNVMIMPSVVYYDKSGKEINRLEWGTSREAIKMLIEHPETKQIPLD